MKTWQRWRSLMRTPRLLWDVAARGRYDFAFDLMPLSVRSMSPAKRLNLLRAGANLLHRRLRAWSQPLQMQVELTSYCNLRCPVCPTGARLLKRPSMAMEPELFEHLLQEVGPYLLTMFLWAWGEPLLHPQLERILRAARRYPMATIISTNGQNLDDEAVVRALIKHPPAYLIVCLDGLTDATNSQFRVGARLAPALAGVRRLAELKQRERQELPVLHMRYIVMRHNEHEVPHVQEFARAHQFELLSLRSLSIIDSSEQTHRGAVPVRPEFRAYDYDKERRVQRDDFVCMQPFWFPTVLADGTVVGCEQDYNAQQPLGILTRQNSFAGIWSSDRARDVRRNIRDHGEELSFCQSCPYADRPGSGDCSFQSFPLRAQAGPVVV